MKIKLPYTYSFEHCLNHIKLSNRFKTTPLKDEHISKITKTGAIVMEWLSQYYSNYYTQEEFEIFNKIELTEMELGNMNAATRYDKKCNIIDIGINRNLLLATPRIKGRQISYNLCSIEESMGYTLSHEFTHVLENERLKKKYNLNNIEEFLNLTERRFESENAAVESEIMFLVENYGLKLSDNQIDWYIEIMTNYQTYTGESIPKIL